MPARKTPVYIHSRRNAFFTVTIWAAMKKVNSIPARPWYCWKLENREKASDWVLPPQYQVLLYPTRPKKNLPLLYSAVRKPLAGSLPTLRCISEWLSPVTGLLPEDTCSPCVQRGRTALWLMLAEMPNALTAWISVLHWDLSGRWDCWGDRPWAPSFTFGLPEDSSVSLFGPARILALILSQHD